MSDLPERILLWMTEQDLINYLAVPVFFEALRRSLKHIKDRKEKEKLRVRAVTHLFRRN